MTVYISLEAAIKAAMQDTGFHRSHEFNAGCARAANNLKAIPAADVAPVVHAEWKINADGYYPYCSACKKEPPGRCMTAHCPGCGAIMDGKRKEDKA